MNVGGEFDVGESYHSWGQPFRKSWENTKLL